MKYKRWTDLPYAGESHPPDNAEQPYAGTWPLVFIQRSQNGIFVDGNRNPVGLVRDPSTIDWEDQLAEVKETSRRLTTKQITIAQYWGAGPAPKQWTPIADKLIDTYYSAKKPENLIVSAPWCGRILAALHGAINDAFVIAWYLKYRLNVARPNQYDPELATVLCTPRHPSYVSGHAAVAGAASTILSYFFPSHEQKLTNLAEEAAMSRLFALVHFPVDNRQGLRLGREIGNAVIRELIRERDGEGAPVDVPVTETQDVALAPPPYDQALPYPFPQKCQSKVLPPCKKKRRKSKKSGYRYSKGK
ncbi:vanadium-dependent haloperoxidase [Mechercharimyces sp. CAU 1602]|uniref:vanadium-dependent haloperoxidase n=1 Tax=Mechercharimyces sp. CAU 1602 TaxID=2973933 RepID=UPI0021627782|nr:vanadium-dependent haloperoxidase [Mechercharimyces sp. CAU 1602]MCS1350799.1 vanadium-dependent haloperoxidase [Mechercharimyces sp. CAU 1602]